MRGIVDDAWRGACRQVHIFKQNYNNSRKEHGNLVLNFMKADRFLYLSLPQVEIRFLGAPRQRIFIDPIVQDPNILIQISHQVVGGKYGQWVSKQAYDHNFHGTTHEMSQLMVFIPQALEQCLSEILRWDGTGWTRGRGDPSETRPSSP